MRRSYFVMLLAGLMIFGSCIKSSKADCDSPVFDCAAVLCIAHWNTIDFNLKSQSSKTDLFWGANPKYTLADIKLFADVARTIPLNVIADSTSKRLKCLNGQSVMYLEIKGATTYTLNAEFRAVNCCSSRIKTLQVNNIFVCTCCDEVVSIPIQ